jgi:hypothetical protein
MKSLFLCLALASMPVFAGQPSAAPGPTTLYTEFHQQPPAAVLAALQDEVASIMEPMGFRFEWRSLSENQGSEVSAELAVVSFKGRCDAAGLAPHSVSPGALGWTHISDGAILPFSDVDCDGIRGFLGKQLLNYSQQERVEVFGRALGRVLAHELYHIFANTTRHGSEGVGKPMYTVQDLVSTDFRFEDREAAAMTSTKPHVLAESAGNMVPRE